MLESFSLALLSGIARVFLSGIVACVAMRAKNLNNNQPVQVQTHNAKASFITLGAKKNIFSGRLVMLLLWEWAMSSVLP